LQIKIRNFYINKIYQCYFIKAKYEGEPRSSKLGSPSLFK